MHGSLRLRRDQGSGNALDSAHQANPRPRGVGHAGGFHASRVGADGIARVQEHLCPVQQRINQAVVVAHAAFAGYGIVEELPRSDGVARVGHGQRLDLFGDSKGHRLGADAANFEQTLSEALGFDRVARLPGDHRAFH